jgi:hypothetical protein
MPSSPKQCAKRHTFRDMKPDFAKQIGFYFWRRKVSVGAPPEQRMDFNLTTPALLFPAISLLLLASLALSIREIQISVEALNLRLLDLEERN